MARRFDNAKQLEAEFNKNKARDLTFAYLEYLLVAGIATIIGLPEIIGFFFLLSPR